ncbi:MAG: type II toxin-antitoxin system VapC family toxin [Planctomycetes bacterium]|nr:type II toxin-antitoxin system VapC family toxin [Planctomycetota bacterium]
MKYVLDASVALKWVLTEPHLDIARRLRQEHQQGQHDFIAPDVFPVEIAHAISKLQRTRKMNEADARVFFGEILTTAPRLFASEPLLIEGFELALHARVGIYDCLYLALANREGCDLLTADERLIRAFPDAPNIIHLSVL